MQRKLLIVTDHFNIAVNDFDMDANKSACCSTMFIVTEHVVNESPWFKTFPLIFPLRSICYHNHILVKLPLNMVVC